MRFRGDIEGLRAAAILPILLFHAGVSVLRGGFIGVDVFFVISGFLITNIIVSDLDSQKFSLLKFYHRRFARILPALIVLMMGTALLGAALYALPHQFEQMYKSMAATSLFGSNIWFFFHTDYFASAADDHPLLHTWSLAVEEQFYIFYPFLLMALHGRGVRTMRVSLIVISLLSFALGLWIDRISPPAGFYLLPTRFWELALGGIVALGGFPKINSRVGRNVLAIGGGGMILIGLAVITAGSGFPAPWAILPCVGTALLLAYGEGTIAGFMLSLPLVRWIGRISYSLYLWHWPLITFYRWMYGHHLSLIDTVILVIASFVAGAASYYLIEQRSQARIRALRDSVAVKTSLAALAVAVTASVGLANMSSRQLLPPDVAAVARYGSYAGTPEHVYQYETGCFISNRTQTFDLARCVPLSSTKRNVVVVGDSHAAQYWRALTLKFPDINIGEASASGCLPLLNARGESRCTSVMRQVFGELVDTGRVDGIVLIARWRPREVDNLARTVRYLQGKGVHVTVFGPVPEYEGVYPYLLARAMMDGDVKGVERFRDKSRGDLDRTMAKAIAATGAAYHSVHDIECPGGACQLFAGPSVPFHFDYGHTTFPAAKLLVNAAPRP